MKRRARPAPAPLLAIPVAIALAFLALPLVALALRTPWTELGRHLASPAVLDALLLSLLCSSSAALACALLGLPLAAWLAHPGGAAAPRTAVRALVVLPMVLPPVVGGVALLMAFGRGGLLGAPLAEETGWALPFTTAAVIVAETFVALPFFVLAAEAGLRSFDRRHADAAATLGAGRLRRFRTVTMPMIAPALRAGLVVAWARALGEFGATITFAGNLAGHTRTMPLAVYVALESQPEAAIALSMILVLVSVALLVLLRHRWFPRR